MNCKQAEELIMKYFDHDINDIDNAQLKQHMKSCKSCSREFAQMSEIFCVLEEANPVEPPLDFEVKVMQQVKALETAKKNKVDGVLVLLYSIAAVALFALSFMLVADVQGITTSELMGKLMTAFGSASGILDMVKNLFSATYTLFTSVTGGLIQVVFLIIKAYYHVFIALMAMVLLLQKMVVGHVRQDNGGAK